MEKVLIEKKFLIIQFMPDIFFAENTPIKELDDN